MPDFDLVARLKDKLKEQQDVLEQILSVPTKTVIVLGVGTETVRYLDGGTVMEAPFDRERRFWLEAGNVAKVSLETGTIVGVAEDDDFSPGPIGTVLKVAGSQKVEVQTETGSFLVLSQRGMSLKPGNRIVLDPSGNLVVRDLGAPKTQKAVSQEAFITWDDIGGLDSAKMALKDAIELPYKRPEIYRRYGMRPPKGIMLYGPPGCGKTLLGRAAVSSLSSSFGREAANSAFVYVKGPEVLSKWVGESEATIRGIFSQSRDHYNRWGFPAVVFIDEADALLGARGNNSVSGIEQTIVPQFLAEMDGLDVVGAPIVLLATNRPDSLDPAVVRDGRVDLKIRVGRPGMNEVEKIFRLNLKGKPIGLIGDDLPAFGALTLFADERPLAEVVCPKGERHRMFHHHAVNGAMVANICTRATQFAIRREINGGMVKGMLKADISSAISDSWKSMKDIDISNELQDFMDARAIQKAIDIRRVG